MSPDVIREKLKSHPFEPFRIEVSDGSSYEVTESDWVLVTSRTVYIGVEPDEGGTPKRSVYCDPLHITRLVPIHQTRSNGRKRKP